MSSFVVVFAVFGLWSDAQQPRAKNLNPLSPLFDIEAFHHQHIERCRRSIAGVEGLIAWEEQWFKEDPKRFPPELAEQRRQQMSVYREEVAKWKKMLHAYESWTPPPGGVITSPSQLEGLDEALKQWKESTSSCGHRPSWPRRHARKSSTDRTRNRECSSQPGSLSRRPIHPFRAGSGPALRSTSMIGVFTRT